MRFVLSVGSKKEFFMSDVWFSQLIAKIDIAQGRDGESIRKNMLESSKILISDGIQLEAIVIEHERY